MSDHRDFYRGPPVLVTGGLGFIGSNLCRTLADLGARVTAVDSLLPDYGGNLFNLADYEDKVRINIADVRGHGMEYLVQGQHVLFNLAGQVSHIDSMTDPVTDLEINCTSQLQVLEAVRQRQPRAEDRLRRHAPGLRTAAVPAGRREAPAAAGRRERHQQDLAASSTTSSTTRCTASAPPRCG